MKKRLILCVLAFILIRNNINADIMTELAKRDRDNPIHLIDEYSPYVLYAKDGYLYTEYHADGFGEPSIVAYKIDEDAVKLIVRIKTWDFAFRIYDYLYHRDGIDQFTVDVHDYYFVELVYAEERLVTYCNRIRDINTNGFIFNEAEINRNINKIEYRSKLLILKSGNTPQATMPQEASDYIGTWRYTGSGGLGFRERTITITISADELHYHYVGYKREYGYTYSELEHGYTLTNLMWTRIIRPDEDFQGNVEMPDDYYKGASGYLITGTVTSTTGAWSPDTNTITEYVYLRPDNKDRIFYYNFYVPNHVLRRQK